MDQEAKTKTRMSARRHFGMPWFAASLASNASHGHFL
jgi:hypothetical protein